MSTHAPAPPIDESAVESFTGQVVGDIAGAMATVFAALGDRLGLFQALAGSDATPDELAERTGLDARHIAEWARGLATAGYLTHDPGTGRFSLPAEHALVLADESSPAFMGAAHHIVREMVALTDRVEQAFRDGKGVPLDAYGEGFWHATERLTRTSFDQQLVQEWVPSIDGLHERLTAGARVADVGTGSGIAPITLAQAYPASTFVGFDIHGPNVTRAQDLARAAGLADRVTFARGDAVAGIDGTFDVITIFLMVHDSADPLAVLRNARAALADDGILLVQEINCHDDLADDAGPVGTLLYGFSLLHCTTQAVAAGGEALGTCGLPASRLRALCLEAGFSSVERTWEGPLDAVYAVRP